MSYASDASTIFLSELDGSGLNLIDASSFGNDSVGVGITPQVEGAFTKGVQTDVSGDHLDLNNVIGDFDPDLFLIEFFFKPSASLFWTDGAQHTLWDARADASNRFQIVKIAGNALLFNTQHSGTLLSINGGLPDGEQRWVHIAMALSDAASEFRAFIDGVEVGNDGTGFDPFVGPIVDLEIGRASTGGFEAFGSYSTVRIRNDYIAIPDPYPFDLRNRDFTAGAFNVALDLPGNRDFQTELRQEVLGL